MLSSKFVRLGRSPRIFPTSLNIQVRAVSHTASTNADQPRSTLSRIWLPTGGVSPTQRESGHDKLVRASFLRQSHQGIFQLLPLGLRVQQKIEDLLDKHMRSIGASRLALSTITSESLWKKSDRLKKVSPELFRFTDRKNTALMLSPTHEEEITSLVASLVNSHKDLPLKLFQITRKYRDEIRPRHGLLRSREFLMKDLYTFDVSYESAIETYKEVSAAYRAFFAEMKLPIIVAEASSGDMGGDHSHEYHLANPVGEDTIATCSSCGYTANDEVATSRPASSSSTKKSELYLWRGISEDRRTLINAWYPQIDGLSAGEGLNIHAVKAVVPELDASIDNPLRYWDNTLQKVSKKNFVAPRLINVIDSRVVSTYKEMEKNLPMIPADFGTPQLEQTVVTETSKGAGINLLGLTDGDGCPRCDTGTLHVQRALELAHTFHLGTRYSKPLKAFVTLPEAPKERLPMQMGCHGIGISRILGSVAEHMSDDKGLKWPRAIAPFEVAIIPTSDVTPETLQLYDSIAGHEGSRPAIDVVLDDRKEKFGWKMQDADLVGYPVLIVLGRAWRDQGLCEIQCRSLGLKDNVSVEEVPSYLVDLLAKL